MCPLLWKQTLCAQRLAVISALLTGTATLFSRHYASLAPKTSGLGHYLHYSGVNRKICNYFVVICSSSNLFSTVRSAALLKTSLKTDNMPPKAKKAATNSKPAKKTEKDGKTEKAKSPKKNDEPKIASRQSKRNVDKVAISYKEVAENVDEKASERRQPVKAAKKAKKSKYVDSGSDVSDESSEEADSEDEKRKKKKAAVSRAKPAKEKKSPAPKRSKKSAAEVKKQAAADDDDEPDDDEDDEKEPEVKKAKVESETEEEEDKKEEKKDDKKEKKDEVKEKKEDKKEVVKEDKKEVKEAPAVKKATAKAEKEAPKKSAKDEDVKEPTNKTTTDFDAINFKSDKTTKDGKPSNYKISSWNICGLKAWMKKGAMDFIKHESPDVFCLMETKCSEAKLPPGTKVDGYHAYWVSGEKEGYAGVGLYSKVMPIEVKYGLGKEEHDNEGRVITAEYEKFFLVATYVPNAGRGLVTLPKRLKWDPDMRSYLKELDDKKPVILCGDLNVAHQSIDLANPKTNMRSAGFTQEERDGMSELLKEGFVDSYRHLYPEKADAYTFWTFMGNARSRNVGWRLDYFVLSEKLLPNLCDNVIRSEVYGSDHCPITLFLNV